MQKAKFIINHYEYRTVLKRKIIELDTEYGKIKAKKVINDNETYIYPEYESIKEIALNNKIPLKELYKINEFILKDEEGAVKKAPSFIFFTKIII